MAGMFRTPRYRTRLIAGVLAVSLPVTALTVAALTERASRELTESTTSFLRGRASHIAGNIEIEITDRRQDIAYVAARAPRLPLPEQQDLMAQLMRQRGGYDVIQLVDLTGRVVASGDPGASFTPPADSEWFRRAATGADTVSPIFLDAAANNIRWVFASTVNGPDGLPIGVVIGDVRIGALVPQLAQADFARSAEVQLIDNERRLLLRETNRQSRRVLTTDADVLADGALTTRFNTDGARRALQTNGVVRYDDVDGVEVYGGHAPVHSMGWGLIVQQDVSEALESVRVQRNLGWLLVLAGALTLAVFSFVFSRREARFIRNLVAESRTTSEEVTASAAEMSSASEQLASTTIEQTGTVTETSATMEELARSSTAIAATVEQVSQQASQTRDSLEQAARDIEASSGRTVALSERVGQVTAILDLINELADQTNILAVNAAIEAARAGESGQGFAVVADEVRRLAERSKASAADIGVIIESTRDETTATVSSMETGARRMAEGLRLLEQVVDGAAQVSLNTQQQGVATQQVVEAMEQLTESSRQVSATAQQIAASAGTLAALASQLEAAATAASARL